jgi:hypothetical protein
MGVVETGSRLDEKLAFAFALALAVISGAATISTLVTTPTAAYGQNDGC